MDGHGHIEDFSREDFERTLQEIKERKEQGEEAEQILQQVLGWMADREQMWRERFRELDTRQDNLEKVMRLLGNWQRKTSSRTHQLSKALGLGGTTLLVKARPAVGSVPEPTAAPAHVPQSPASLPMTLEQVATKGMLAKAIVRVFGPRGGKHVLYNKDVASRLLMKGAITDAQHAVWKRSNRLPDHVSLN